MWHTVLYYIIIIYAILILPIVAYGLCSWLYSILRPSLQSTPSAPSISTIDAQNHIHRNERQHVEEKYVATNSTRTITPKRIQVSTLSSNSLSDSSRHKSNRLSDTTIIHNEHAHGWKQQQQQRSHAIYPSNSQLAYDDGDVQSRDYRVIRVEKSSSSKSASTSIPSPQATSSRSTSHPPSPLSHLHADAARSSISQSTLCADEDSLSLAYNSDDSDDSELRELEDYFMSSSCPVDPIVVSSSSRLIRLPSLLEDHSPNLTRIPSHELYQRNSDSISLHIHPSQPPTPDLRNEVSFEKMFQTTLGTTMMISNTVNVASSCGPRATSRPMAPIMNGAKQRYI